MSGASSRISTVNPWVFTWKMLIRPSEVIFALEERWNWFPAWLVAVAVTLMGQIPAIINYTKFVSEVAATSDIPANVIEAQKWLTITSNALNPPITFLGQALICAGLLSLVSALDGSLPRGFGRWYSIAMWAIFPSACGAAVFKALVHLLYQGPPVQVFAGPAVWLPQDAHGLLKSLFVSLDIFSLWFIMVCSFGVYLLGRRRIQPAALSGSLLFGYTMVMSYINWH